MVSILVLLVAPCCFAQDPVAIIDFSWQRTRLAARKVSTDDVTPARAMTADDKYYQRTARDNQSKSTVDPRENTIDGRRDALEKIMQESRSTKPGDTNGYSYLANVKNDSPKTVSVVFWEYRFTELANPLNVVRRQFLCSVDLKPGDKKGLAVFSTLGPSDVIDAESLAKATGKLFDEKVVVNRIEYSDGTLRQRGSWKYEDFQKAIDHVTSTPWGKEICRSF